MGTLTGEGYRDQASGLRNDTSGDTSAYCQSSIVNCQLNGSPPAGAEADVVCLFRGCWRAMDVDADGQRDGLCSYHRPLLATGMYLAVRAARAYDEMRAVIGKGDRARNSRPACRRAGCRVPGCTKPLKTRGVCHMHYQRSIYGRDPEKKAEAMRWMV